MVQEFHFLKIEFEPLEFLRSDRQRGLQRPSDLVGIGRVVAPERSDVAADHAAAAEFDQALKYSHGSSLGDRGQCRLSRGDIDRGAGHGKLAYFTGKPSGVDQRQPAALAKPDQIDQAAKLIDKDIEIGKIVVDSEISHLRTGRAPIGHEQSFNSGTAKRGDETVSGGQVGDSGSMQRKRRTQQRWNAAVGYREVPQPNAAQLERNPVRRGAFRLLCRSEAVLVPKPGRRR